MERVKLLVVGGGPAGIACGVESKEEGLEPVVILEKSNQVCDTIQRLYRPGKRVDAVYRGLEVTPVGRISFETQSKEEFLKMIDNYISRYQLDLRLNSEVNWIGKDGDFFKVNVKGEPKFLAQFVVVAIGMFGQPKKPDYPIPKEVKDKVFFEPPSICPSSGRVLVVGGGDTAAETAVFACKNCEVFLSYRRPQFFRINPVNLSLLEEKAKSGKVNLMLGTDIEKLEAEGDRVKVCFKDGQTEVFDFVYYCLGGSSPKGFLKYVGVEFDLEERPKIDEFYETNIPGLFLAGDIAVPKGSIQVAFNTAHIIIKRIKERV